MVSTMSYLVGGSDCEEDSNARHDSLRKSLCPWDRDIITSVLNSCCEANKNTCLGKVQGIDVLSNAMRTLQPAKWLNDEIINFYFQLLQQVQKFHAIYRII